MFDEVQYIKLKDKTHPIKCDLLVLEKIQDEFGSIWSFEQGLMTTEPVLDEEGNPVVEIKENGEESKKRSGKMPDIKTVNKALFWMVKEGEEILAGKEGRAPEKIIFEDIVRKADVNIMELAVALHMEFYRCVTRKNEETTQEKTKRAKQTMESSK